jgi:hypothetical protein
MIVYISLVHRRCVRRRRSPFDHSSRRRFAARPSSGVGCMGMERTKRAYVVPDRWQAHAVARSYENLAKSLHVESPAPMVGRFGHRLSECTVLSALYDALSACDPAAQEICVAFVVAPVYFSTSGYLRAAMARRLRNCELQPHQIEVLRKGLVSIFESGDFGSEAKDLLRLLVHIGPGREAERLSGLNQSPSEKSRWAWQWFNARVTASCT